MKFSIYLNRRVFVMRVIFMQEYISLSTVAALVSLTSLENYGMAMQLNIFGAKIQTTFVVCFVLFFILYLFIVLLFFTGFYGLFKYISLLSSRSFFKGGRKPENPGKKTI